MISIFTNGRYQQLTWKYGEREMLISSMYVPHYELCIKAAL